MNFALLLLMLSLLSGLIVLFDKLCWAKKRKEGEKLPKMIDYSYSYFPVFFLVLCLRSFLVEPFRIPSGSLEPTLQIGDFVAVNKFRYGFHLPVLETKILPIKNPKTGDIAVFRWPPDPSFDYIKRVIGVPGEIITYHNKILTIDGRVQNQTFVEST